MIASPICASIESGFSCRIFWKESRAPSASSSSYAPLGGAQAAGEAVVAVEHGELERRRSPERTAPWASRPGRRRPSGAAPPPRPRRRRGRRPRRRGRSHACEATQGIERSCVGSTGLAILIEAMASYRDLLAQVRAEIDETDALAARGRLESGDAIFVDVRERAEWDEGHVPGAVHIPRGSLESRAEGLLPDRGQPLVVYCAAGSRSAFAAKTLEELGYVSVVSLAGGFTDWKRNGLPVEIPQTLDAQQRRALQPAPADPRGRRGRPGEAAERARAPDRRGRARLARVALPRRGGSGNARDRRRRRRGRVEPPAADRPLDRAARRLEGRVGEAHDRGAQPRRDRGGLRRAPDDRERRPHPRRGLGRHRGRRRQLPHALPR